MWEKEKMLVTSIFYISHNVFKSFLKVVKSQDSVIKSKVQGFNEPEKLGFWKHRVGKNGNSSEQPFLITP